MTGNFMSFNLCQFSIVAKQITTNSAFLTKSAVSTKILRHLCAWIKVCVAELE